jgi:hypothetical protein
MGRYERKHGAFAHAAFGFTGWRYNIEVEHSDCPLLLFSAIWGG